MSPHHRSHLDPKDLKNSGLKHLQPIETTGSTSQAPIKEKHRWPKTTPFETSNFIQPVYPGQFQTSSTGEAVCSSPHQQTLF